MMVFNVTTLQLELESCRTRMLRLLNEIQWISLSMLEIYTRHAWKCVNNAAPVADASVTL